jgi:uncharacterized protein (DUF2235 family)
MALYAFDGTWNKSVVDDEKTEDHDTNVVRFYEAYDGPKWYVSGPGTRLGKLGKALGGFTGAGAGDRLREAYKQLVSSYQREEPIDIVGFSRGAAIALDFANLIHENGIRNPDTGASVEDKVDIRFLGLWDVVGSFGVPIGERVFQKLNFGHKLSVPPNVEYAFHALAMDDRRQSFRPTRQLNAYEVWFRGVHSDVGGGNGNVGLSSIALAWMLCKAKKVGLPLKSGAINTCNSLRNADADLRLPKDLIENDLREFWEGDRIHYSVKDREGHNNAPAGFARESEQDELDAIARAQLPHREEPKSRPSAQAPSGGPNIDC